MARIDEYLRLLRRREGTALHLAGGHVPRLRIAGTLQPLDPSGQPLSDDVLIEMLRELTTAGQWKRFLQQLDLSFPYELDEAGRFRVRYLQQQGGVAAVFRAAPQQVPELEQLGLPAALARLALSQAGLVLVAGPPGAGKSTTLAALIGAICRTYRKHVITIEDPIEIVFEHRESVVSQREVGTHCPSLAAGVQAALRQQPDVLLISDLADGEAARLAVEAAEQGTLVLAALRANSVVKALDRLLESCPPSRRGLLRGGLAEVLVGVVAQLLLPAADGSGRRAAVEVLLRTDTLPELLRTGDTAAIQQLMQSGKQLGMHTMDESLIELAHKGAVPPHEASRKVMDSALFERRFQS